MCLFKWITRTPFHFKQIIKSQSLLLLKNRNANGHFLASRVRYTTSRVLSFFVRHNKPPLKRMRPSGGVLLYSSTRHPFSVHVQHAREVSPPSTVLFDGLYECTSWVLPATFPPTHFATVLRTIPHWSDGKFRFCVDIIWPRDGNERVENSGCFNRLNKT